MTNTTPRQSASQILRETQDLLHTAGIDTRLNLGAGTRGPFLEAAGGDIVVIPSDRRGRVRISTPTSYESPVTRTSGADTALYIREYLASAA